MAKHIRKTTLFEKKGVWGPYGHRLSLKQKFKGYLPQLDGTLQLEQTHGPRNSSERRAAF